MRAPDVAEVERALHAKHDITGLEVAAGLTAANKAAVILTAVDRKRGDGDILRYPGRIHPGPAAADIAAEIATEIYILYFIFIFLFFIIFFLLLAAIRGSASVLDSMRLVQNDDQASSLVEVISDEVAELDGFIQNLLNATRVTAGGVNPHLEWSDPRDIVDAAIKRRARRLASHKLEIKFAEDLPLVNVNSGLIEESCGQLLENAAKYSPSGSTISVNARREKDDVVISISDQGVGITPDERRNLGRKSFRSQRHQATIPGSGLGYWIASVFVGANGGAIDISSPGQGLGTTASITLPGSLIKPSELAAMTNE